jgi:hypothetical protein
MVGVDCRKVQGFGYAMAVLGVYVVALLLHFERLHFL